ncbi:hypothetical protein E4U19_005887 [Claviceps sp. Clav32 group G5]|nr:hypothetical protein E4U19_005887 [Claviceps sp. Clav32 group G5]KAG6036852.1 hypothetical protein E4U40_007757 [Claviceps sp. LM458 group G5]KAG6048841.1 hypothetical protein E4U39_006902 [Claviceps sp. Clav50 group G5]
MKWTSAAFLGLASSVVAEVGILKPDSPPPAGCSANRDGKFQVSIYSLGKSKRDLQKRACGAEGTLVMTLKDGVLKDSKDRTGSIVANYQFQFDGPPQAGSIYTAGFSTCNNGSLALGGSTVFYRCLSGDFYNLYDRHWAAQCEPIEIVATSCDGDAKSAGNTAPAPTGNKPVGTSMVQTTIVTVIGDGQPQVHTTVVPVPMCQIGDGQVQIRTTPCASIPPAGTKKPQGPTGAPPVHQISDGQIQAPPKTAAPPPPVSQINDGQPQAPIKTGTPPPPPVSQVSDGQPQGPKGTAPVVSQIGDGQIQAPTGPAPTAPASQVPVAGAEKLVPGLVAIGAVALVGMFL